jgi:hypothetical protein
MTKTALVLVEPAGYRIAACYPCEHQAEAFEALQTVSEEMRARSGETLIVGKPDCDEEFARADSVETWVYCRGIGWVAA